MITFRTYEKLNLKQKLIYCIDAFETLLNKKQWNEAGWTEVLQILKEINDSEFLDEWFYKYCEIRPDIILAENDYYHNQEDWEYISLEQFTMLKKLYQESEATPIISPLIKLIHEIGSIELYTDSKQASKRSFSPFSKFMAIVQDN